MSTPTDYQVVEASSLKPATGDLQPRDRPSRAASEAQIAEIAGKLDPAQVGASPVADYGAPVVMPDGTVLAGNGRLAAINRAAELHPDKYQAYRDSLTALGHDVSSMERPILVRRTGDLTPDQARTYAEASNAPRAMTMSPVEQARVDARNLTEQSLAKYDASRPLTSPANSGFIREWMGSLAPAERNRLIDAQGQLSSEGIRRLQGAVLAKAYDHDPILKRALESPADDVKSITGTLMDVAAPWMKLRGEITAGRLPKELDVTQNLTDALDLIQQARDKGIAPGDMLKQGDIFGGAKLNPITEQIVRTFYNDQMTRLRSRPRMTEAFRDFVDQALAYKPGKDLFGAETQPDAADMLRKAREGKQGGLIAAEDNTARTLQQTIPRLQDYVGRLEAAGRSQEAAQAREQLTRAQEALARYQPKAKPLPTPTPGRPLDIRDYKQNDGTSTYQKAFSDAGHDPANAVNYPVPRQVNILKDHVVNTFGFTDVNIAPTKRTIEAREQLLDLHRAIYDMTGTLGFSQDFASLQGELRLSLEPPMRKRGGELLGLYDPNTKTIHVMGRANSFGHEWIHALDHNLAERLMTVAPSRRMALLSQYGRHGYLDPSADVQARFAKLLNTLFFDEGDLALTKTRLQYEAAQLDLHGNPTKAALTAQAELAKLEKGALDKRLAQSSEYRRLSEQFNPAQKGYFGNEAELLARAGEAYLAEQMKSAGVDPRGVVMPDEAYLNETDRMLKDLYPKAQDRADIFRAYGDLFDGLRASGWFGSPARAMSMDFGVVDPHGFERLVSKDKRGLSLMRPIRATADALANARSRWADVAPFDVNRPISDRAWTKRLKMGAQEIAYTRLGWMDEIIKAAPDASKPALQQLRNKLGPRRGTGEYTPEGFEEEARNHSRRGLFQASNVFANNGLEHMSALDNAMLYDFMQKGADTYQGAPIPDNIKRAGRGLRKLMDDEYHANTGAGIELNYVQDAGYLPHLYDHAAVHADGVGFTDAATSVYKDVWDRDVHATDPVQHADNIIERWNNLSGADKAMAGQRLTQQIAELKQRMRELTQLPTVRPPDVIRAEIDALVNQIHNPLGTFVADQGANDWRSRINIGYPGDYDKIGPSGNYLNNRKLPSDAYEKLAPWMITDVKTLVGRYIEQSGRKIAYAKRFGVDGGEIERLITQAEQAAHDAGQNFYDGPDVRRIIKSITGRTNSDNARVLSDLSNFTSAWASLVTMPRALWSSLNEPAISAALHRDPRAAFITFGKQLGQFLHTADSYDRTELADWLGVTASRMSESIMMARTSVDFADSPRMGAIMQNFYRASGLTPWTNSVRRASASMNHGFLQKYARDLLSTEPGARWDNKRDDATRMFNELGVPPQYRTDFAQWLTQRDALPKIEDMKNDPMQPVYSLALRRLVDWSSPDPYKGDRPMLQDHPWLRLLWAWQSFNGAFTRAIIEPTLNEVEHAASRAYQRGRAAGAGRTYSFIKGTGAATTATTWALSGYATLLSASLLSTIPRQYFFARDQWDKHDKEGDLGEWLFDLSVQRSGLNGMLDPVLQAYTALKYKADVSGLLEGGPVSFLTGNLANMLFAASSEGQPGTNTRAHNAVAGGYDLLAAPAISYAATVLAGIGGPVMAGPASIAMQLLTTPSAASKFADIVTGEKGAKPEQLTQLQQAQRRVEQMKKRAHPEKPAAAEGGAGLPTTGSIPIGFMDDVAQPLWRVVRPMLGLIPGPVKAGAAAAAALYGAGKFISDMEPFRNAPPPDKKP